MRDKQEGTEVSSIRARAGGSFLPDRSAGRGHCSFDEPSLLRDSSRVPYLSVHRLGYHCLPHPGDSLRPYPTKFAGPPKLLPVPFLYRWFILAYTSDFPKFSQTSSIWPQQAPYPLLSGPRPGTSSSRAWYTVWPLLGTSKPSTSSSHLPIAL